MPYLVWDNLSGTNSDGPRYANSYYRSHATHVTMGIRVNFEMHGPVPSEAIPRGISYLGGGEAMIR